MHVKLENHAPEDREAGGAGPGDGAQARTLKAEQAKATRSALIAAARALFAERGYAAVGTEEIVRAAGVTRGALYHHFAGKQELFQAVYESVEQQLVEQIAASAVAGASDRSEEHTSELQSLRHLVCRLLLE